MDLLGEHLFWTISRAAGIAALLLASASVGLGLLQGGKVVKARLRDARPLHEALSLATLAALVVHAVSLLGDSYLRPSLGDITIPLVSGYQTFWMSLGIVAGWSLLLLGGSFYLRARIGVQRWRTLHRFTALAWLLSIVHALGMGTDAGRWWFLAAVGLAVLPTLAVLVVRMTGSRPPSAKPMGGPGLEPGTSRL